MKFGRIALLILVGVSVIGLTSCEALLNMLFGGGIEIADQIESFETTLNRANRADILTHFHPDMTGYQQLADPEVIDAGPLSYAHADFEFGTPVVDGNDIANCTFLNGDGAAGTIVFTMVLDGSDYKINKIVLTISKVEYVLERFGSN